jgi:hypothetical protein
VGGHIPPGEQCGRVSIERTGLGLRRILHPVRAVRGPWLPGAWRMPAGAVKLSTAWQPPARRTALSLTGVTSAASNQSVSCKPTSRHPAAP